jgi:hypothetical protein
VTQRKWYHAALGVLTIIGTALAAVLVAVLRGRPKPKPAIRLPKDRLYSMPLAEVVQELTALGLTCGNPAYQEDMFWQFPKDDGWETILEDLVVPASSYVPSFNDCEDFCRQAQGAASGKHHVKVIMTYGLAPDRDGELVPHAFGLLRRGKDVYDILEPSRPPSTNILKWWPQGPNEHGYKPQIYFK